jgi:hypothetical protein
MTTTEHEASIAPRGWSDVLFVATCTCGWTCNLDNGMFRRQAEIVAASHAAIVTPSA